MAEASRRALSPSVSLSDDALMSIIACADCHRHFELGEGDRAPVSSGGDSDQTICRACFQDQVARLNLKDGYAMHVVELEPMIDVNAHRECVRISQIDCYS